MKNEEIWQQYVDKNTDAYGKCCVDVARKVMELLDNDPTPLHTGYYPDIHTAHGLICKADDDIKAGSITGFMAGCVAQMVFQCHERGEEFKISFNGEEISDGVINPALITVNMESD